MDFLSFYKTIVRNKILCEYIATDKIYTDQQSLGKIIQLWLIITIIGLTQQNTNHYIKQIVEP